MAMLITPTQDSFQSWGLDKMSQYPFESPASEISSGLFFDAEERIRIESAMSDYRSVLANRTSTGLDDAYQSSEEALSPMLEEEATEEDADDEDTAEESTELEYLSELTSFQVDIAVAICVAAAGKAKVVNLPSRWATFRKSYERPVSQSTTSIAARPPRSSSKTPIARINTDLPSESTSNPPTTNSSRSASSHSTHSSLSMKPQQGSLHRTIPSDASSKSWGLSASDQSAFSVAASFLESDPHEAVQPKTTGLSRLRNISAKFKSSTNNSPVTDEPADLPTPKEIKQKRRRSLVQSARPETTTPTPFFFSQRAREEWHREQAQLQRASTAPVVTTTPTTQQQRKPPKMMARGANEREPALQLPPCPPDYDMDVPALAANPRLSSAGAGQLGRRRSSRLHA